MNNREVLFTTMTCDDIVQMSHTITVCLMKIFMCYHADQLTKRAAFLWSH